MIVLNLEVVFMDMCICVGVYERFWYCKGCVYTWEYVYRCVHVYIRVYMYVYVCILFICVYTCIYCVYVCILCICVYTCVYVCIRVHFLNSRMGSAKQLD